MYFPQTRQNINKLNELIRPNYFMYPLDKLETFNSGEPTFLNFPLPQTTNTKAINSCELIYVLLSPEIKIK